MNSSHLFFLQKVYFTLFALQLITTVYAEILSGPNDTEASVGETATLQCTSSLNSTVPSIEWHHFEVGKPHELVYNDGFIYNKYKGRYDVSGPTGHCNLIIKNITLDDAGKFICMDSGEENSQKAAELIVFARFPSDEFCNAKINFAPEYVVELTCRMEYRGNIIPYMEWLDSDGNVVNSATTTFGAITSSTIRITKDRVKDSFSCHLRFTESKLISKYKWSYSSFGLGFHSDQSSTSSINEEFEGPSTEMQSTAVTPFLFAVLVCSLVLCGILATIIIRKQKYRKCYRRNDPETVNRSTSGSDPKENEKLLEENAEELTNNAIFGLAILNDIIFTMFRESRRVSVYDLHTLKAKGSWRIPGLVNPSDMASCAALKCIYISDWRKAGEDTIIFVVNSEGEIQTKWMLEGEKGRLSVTNQATIIVAQSWYNVVKEYESQGNLISKIQLDRQKLHLWLAIKLPNGNFVISLGDKDDEIQEVSVISPKGNVMHSFDKYSPSISTPMSVPRSLAVDSQGNIYVADLYKRRIIVLNSELEFKEEISETEEKQKIRGPLRICLHESESKIQLFVADNTKDQENRWCDGKIEKVTVYKK